MLAPLNYTMAVDGVAGSWCLKFHEGSTIAHGVLRNAHDPRAAVTSIAAQLPSSSHSRSDIFPRWMVCVCLCPNLASWHLLSILAFVLAFVRFLQVFFFYVFLRVFFLPFTFVYVLTAAAVTSHIFYCLISTTVSL